MWIANLFVMLVVLPLVNKYFNKDVTFPISVTTDVAILGWVTTLMSLPF